MNVPPDRNHTLTTSELTCIVIALMERAGGTIVLTNAELVSTAYKDFQWRYTDEGGVEFRWSTQA